MKHHMSIVRRIRQATGRQRDRRKSLRVRCRLNCTMRRRRTRIPARVLDVSEGGLCVLSPIPLQREESVVLHIDVPPHGPVEVQAKAWHVRRMKRQRAGRETWSIGMMITGAGVGLESLFPGGRQGGIPSEAENAPREPTSQTSDALYLDSEELSPEWEEWSNDWDQRFEESEKLVAKTGEAPNADLQLFRVRVKASTGPRTRTLTLSAASKAEAEELAKADLDASWVVLEVEAA